MSVVEQCMSERGIGSASMWMYRVGVSPEGTECERGLQRREYWQPRTQTRVVEVKRSSQLPIPLFFKVPVVHSIQY